MVNPNILIGSFLVGISPNGHKLCIFVFESQQIENKHGASAI